MPHTEFTDKPRVAYFTMEIALRSEIPTYSGGLGVLAGDTMRSATDLEVPMVAVSLVSRAGYFNQTIDAGGCQVESPAMWDPSRWATPLPARVALTIENRSIWVGGWLYVIEGHMNGRQPVVLLDTNLSDNTPQDREITHYLYGGDQAYRLKQEVVLGIGGVRMLQALGFRVLEYHMNEGHSSLLTLELLRRHAYSRADVREGEAPYDVPLVREMCNFTTHTPVEAGHDKFPYVLVESTIDEIVDMATVRRLGGSDHLNMTRLALNMSEYVNGVARSHAKVSAEMFPGYRVNAITNGVHPYTWTSPSFRGLYDRELPGWCHEPDLLVRATHCLSDEAVLAAHEDAKNVLLARIETATGQRLEPDIATLGFARRMTAYKRPDLLFHDLDRLMNIAERHPFQIVLAGKAHPHDEAGKRAIESLHKIRRHLENAIPVVYLPNYDIAMALDLVSGSDVWLNTPLPPLEASGTSGMKAAFNGVPSLSVADGWWIEGCIEGVTGWSIGGRTDVDRHPDILYDKLENVVLPLCYGDRAGWIAVMKGAISINASFFNSHRMMRRYTTEAYVK